jgi:hypothetical protein
LFLPAVFAIDLLNAAIERGWQGIPEMQECVFLESDVHEHRLQAVFDVLHAALEDAADNVPIGFAFDGILFEHAIFEQGDAAFEFFAINDEFVAGLARSQSDQSFDTFGHGNELGVKFA